MKKNPYGRILKWKSKEQYLSTVLKYCPKNITLAISTNKAILNK